METATAPAGGLRYAFAPLRHRDFALAWWAGLVSNIGSWLQTLAVPYVLYVLTGSKTWLGFSAFAMFFPAVLIGPLAGTLADRFERRRIILASQTVQMGAAAALWALWVVDKANPWSIVACLLVSSVAQGLNLASWQSFVPQLVPEDDMLGAVRLNSMMFTTGRTVGPAIGGLVLGAFGAATAFGLNAISFVGVIVALLAVRPRATEQAPAGEHWLRQFRDGWRYTRARDGLFLPVLMTTCVALFGQSLLQLAPAFATDDFHVDEAKYGLLVAAYGVGAVLGSLAMSAYGDHLPRSRTAKIGLVLYVTGVLLLAVAPSYDFGMAALLVMGVAHVVVSISGNTSIQIRVADQFRGRVISIYLMGLMAAVPLGALLEGWVADRIGLQAMTVATGVCLAGFAVYAVVRYRGLTPLDETLEAEAV